MCIVCIVCMLCARACPPMEGGGGEREGGFIREADEQERRGSESGDRRVSRELVAAAL